MKFSVRNVSISIFALFLIFASLKIKATSSSISGSCGAMMSLKSQSEVLAEKLWFYNPDASTVTVDGNLDAMVLINFDEAKIYVNITKLNVTSNTIQSQFGDYRDLQNTYSTETLSPVSVTISAGPLPGSYLLTPPANTIPELFLMPVNSNNTFLIQAKNNKATGVCQKI